MVRQPFVGLSAKRYTSNTQIHSSNSRRIKGGSISDIFKNIWNFIRPVAKPFLDQLSNLGIKKGRELADKGIQKLADTAKKSAENSQFSGLVNRATDFATTEARSGLDKAEEKTRDYAQSVIQASGIKKPKSKPKKIKIKAGKVDDFQRELTNKLLKNSLI